MNTMKPPLVPVVHLVSGRRYTHSSQTDIRRTWIDHLPPEQNDDPVWRRISAQVTNLERSDTSNDGKNH